MCSRRGLAPFVFQLVQPSMSEWAKYYTFNKLFHVMCYALPYLSRVDTLYGNLIQKIDVLFMTWFSNNLSVFFFFLGQTDLPLLLMLITMGSNHFLRSILCSVTFYPNISEIRECCQVNDCQAIYCDRCNATLQCTKIACRSVHQDFPSQCTPLCPEIGAVHSNISLPAAWCTTVLQCTRTKNSWYTFYSPDGISKLFC